MEVYIITGASKGIGASLMEQLLQEGHIVHGFARTNENNLENLHIIDITTNKVHKVLEDILTTYDQATSYTLINNAGTVEPINQIGQLHTDMITQAIELNITAPIALTNTFIHFLQKKNCEKRVMNISSGAGRKSYEGWGVYGSTKAAIDHFSTIVAAEQQTEKYPVTITSIAPGIVDTNMQTIIRSRTEDEFPLIDRFIHYKQSNALATPKETAERLLSFLRSGKMGEIIIADVRDTQ